MADSSNLIGGHSGPLQVDPGSFRDREAFVFLENTHVYRVLSARAVKDWSLLRETKAFRKLTDSGSLVNTKVAEREAPDGYALVLQHERIPFVTYPYEWPFSMLKAAALLQLEIVSSILSEGMILKDSTPFNVQWIGTRPVFIDIGSFERLEPGQPWLGYRQFCEMFLNPLLLQSLRNVDFQPLLRGRIDGIPVREARRLLAGRDLFRRGVLSHVWLHSKLQNRYEESRTDQAKAIRSSGFATEMIRTNVRGLVKLVERLEWNESESTWSDYESSHSYDPVDREWKERFVRETVHLRPRRLVWDLGCNTGAFSRIAAESGAFVVAIDADHLAVDRMFRRLSAENNESILPLVMNLADPSPSLGWRGTERPALDQRDEPDLVLALALIHHMVISANIPLPQIVDWFASLGCDLVIEFPRRNDPMVEKLLRGKRDNYSDYDEDRLAALLSERWPDVRREVSGSETRVLFAARRG